MILELENGVVSLLQNAGLPVSPWSGRPEELFERPKYIPTIRTVIERVSLEKNSGHSFDLNAHVAIILFFRSLRDEGKGAYPIIKTIIDTTANKTANGFLLSPKDITLLYHESGEFAYKLTFTAEGKYIVPQKSEPLVKEITYEEVPYAG